MTRITHDQARPVDRDPVEIPAAQPDLAQLQQRDDMPVVVPVRQDGPVEVHPLPARSAPAFQQSLDAVLRNVLSADLKRKRAVLIGNDTWLYSHSATGRGVLWPGLVPLEITHGDAVYAAEHPDATNPVNLSVIVEVWAD